MELVHGINKAREMVIKELHTSEEHGAVLRYRGEDTVIEPNLKVWEAIYHKDMPPERYKNVFYHITNDCNKDCSFCYNRDLLIKNPAQTSIERLKKSYDLYVPSDERPVVPFSEYKYDGIHPTVSFVGGEPTVAKTLLPFLHHICDTSNNKIYCFTNGINLLDPAFVKQFPDTPQLCWALSTGPGTEEDFVNKIIENIGQTKQEYAFNIMLGFDDKSFDICLELDAFLRTHSPQEIRYRTRINQLKGTSDYVSDALRFIEYSRGISIDHYLKHAHMARGGFVNSLKPEFSDDPSKGRVATASIPVWNQQFGELICNWGSFTVNTKFFSTPAEGHMSCPALYKWRMARTDRYKTPETEIVWGKVNPYY